MSLGLIIGIAVLWALAIVLIVVVLGRVLRSNEEPLQRAAPPRTITTNFGRKLP